MALAPFALVVATAVSPAPDVVAQTSVPVLTPTEPTQLFRAACMAGSARLKRDQAKQVSFSDVPIGARAALGKTRAGLHHSQWVARKAPYSTEPVQQAEIPNSIYRIRAASETFLLQPVRHGEGNFARSCAVVWKGEEYLKARRAIIGAVNEGPDDIMLPHENPDRYGYTFQESGDFMISIVTFKGWTALVGAPKLDVKPEAAR